jgi:hypothetical protein
MQLHKNRAILDIGSNAQQWPAICREFVDLL